jgi:TonB-linked SusC/RagA family outer membrane protein
VTSAESGAPIENANVTIEALSISARTNTEGTYTIVVPGSRASGQRVVLRARALGYSASTQEFALTPGAHSRDFSLKRDINRLDEIMVTGTVTGTEQKKLAFSVAKVDASDIPIPAVNGLTSLQGRIAGAHIVQPSGRPGQAPAIILRGPKSLDATGRSQDPLIILDGAILNAGTQDINPDDIESIEVIKGAAASTLYGSRAGAGVIQITTRSARQNGTRMSLRSEFGFNDTQRSYQYARRHFLMMDEKYEKLCIKQTGALCQRVIDIDTELRRINDTTSAGALFAHLLERDYSIAGGAPTRPELRGLFQVNHWPKLYDPMGQVMTPGRFVTNSVDLSSRTGSTSYFASLSALNQEGTFFYLRGYGRASARLNVDQAVGSDLTVALNSSFTRSVQFPAGGGGAANTGLNPASETGQFFALTRIAPMANLHARDHLGRLFIRTNLSLHGQQDQNPLYDYENTNGRADADRLIASLATRYAPATWLNLDATLSTDRRKTGTFFFRDRGYRTTNNQAFGGFTGVIGESNTSDLSYNAMLASRASFGVGDDAKITLTGRYSDETQSIATNSVSGTDFAVPGLMTISNATQSTIVANSGRVYIRAVGAIGGAQVDYKDRYIIDGLYRYDGSSLFGAHERWHPYYRTSLAWRASDETFWPMASLLNDFKLRASIGTAGGRPNVNAQYETLALAGGVPSAVTLGNENLKPERTFETEFGFDAEVRSRYGVSFSYARDITSDQLLLVPAPVASGYPNKWANAGTLDGETWELSLRLPIVQTRSLVWNSTINWDRNRTYITRLDIPPTIARIQRNTGDGVRLYLAPGVRYGTIVGRRWMRECSELPAPFNTQCGPGREWQKNDEGYIVWIGAGHRPTEGVTLNLWQAVRPACLRNGVPVDVTGIPACEAAGGVVNTPWGFETSWGMPTLVRDSNANPAEVELGNTMPDFRVSMGHDLQRGRVTFHGLLDVAVGSDIFHEERHWSYGDFAFRDQDQDGKTVETAKPIGYYWRAGRPAAGVGGFYDASVVASNRTVEDGSYAKLRELSLGYSLAGVRRMCDCTVSVVARNLYTWTRYTGWDPEAGLAGGTANSAAIAATGSYQYPQMRTFTFAITSRF